MAKDFDGFAEAGRALSTLHLGYEACEEYYLDIAVDFPGLFRGKADELSTKRMKFSDKVKSSLVVNDHVRINGIPSEAHKYHVNGRTPIEWFIDRYKVTQDKESGIVNDPNEWFEYPDDLISAIKRIVYVSVATKIVENLPSPFDCND